MQPSLRSDTQRVPSDCNKSEAVHFMFYLGFQYTVSSLACLRQPNLQHLTVNDTTSRGLCKSSLVSTCRTLQPLLDHELSIKHSAATQRNGTWHRHPKLPASVSAGSLSRNFNRAVVSRLFMSRTVSRNMTAQRRFTAMPSQQQQKSSIKLRIATQAFFKADLVKPSINPRDRHSAAFPCGKAIPCAVNGQQADVGTPNRGSLAGPRGQGTPLAAYLPAVCA